MPNTISIDDLDTQHIDYSGSWQVSTTGSSRQWESSTHTTTQSGATATFRFSGYQVWIFATTPSGTGSNFIDVSIDGGPAVSISMSSGGDAVYDVQYFQSNVLSDSFHQLVVTNKGSSANGHPQPFVLDKLEFVTAANSVTWPTASDFPLSTSNGSSSSSPGSSTSSGSSTSAPGSGSSSGSTNLPGSSSSGTTPGSGSNLSQAQVSAGSNSQVQSKESPSTATSSSATSSKSSVSTTSASLLPNVPTSVSAGTSVSTSPSTITATSTVTTVSEPALVSSSKTPVGAIAGGLIGALAFIILILSYLLWRRRRQARFNVIDDGEKGPKRSPLAPNPFVLDEVTEASDPHGMPGNLQSHNPFNEKSAYQSQLHPVSTESLLPTSGNANANSSDYEGPSTLVLNHAASVTNIASPSSMYMRGDSLKSPSVNADFDNAPPPSYTQKYDIAQ